MSDFRFGVATGEITPPFRCGMHGYSARKDYFDCANDPLTFTAVVFESNGKRAMIATADICNFPNDARTPAWQEQLAKIVGCSAGEIMLNASHTHGGPAIPTSNPLTSWLKGDQSVAEKYADWMFEQMQQITRRAVDNMTAGTLVLIEGKTAFPMNRRKMHNGAIANMPNPQGEIDDRLQLLVCRDEDKQVRAVIQRLSCHPVSVGPQHRLTADFVGGWRNAFADVFGKEVQPVFLQGTAGEMRPKAVADGDQWRFASYEELPAMGRDLMRETMNTLLNGKVTPIEQLTLRGEMFDVVADCEEKYTTAEDLQPLLDSEHLYERNYATWRIAELEAGREITTKADYRAQVLWLSDDIALVGLNVEPLIALGQKIEKAFSPYRAIVLGYTNGCVSYAPDTEELRRGGYEADSYLFDGWSGPWKQGLEHAFIPKLMKSLPTTASRV